MVEEGERESQSFEHFVIFFDCWGIEFNKLTASDLFMMGSSRREKAALDDNT